MVWDPEGTRLISADTHHQNIDFNIYEGMEVTGVPAVTISRGRILWKDGQLRTERGTGKYFNRPPFPADAVQRDRKLRNPHPLNAIDSHMLLLCKSGPRLNVAHKHSVLRERDQW